MLDARACLRNKIAKAAITATVVTVSGSLAGPPAFRGAMLDTLEQLPIRLALYLGLLLRILLHLGAGDSLTLRGCPIYRKFLSRRHSTAIACYEYQRLSYVSTESAKMSTPQEGKSIKAPCDAASTWAIRPRNGSWPINEALGASAFIALRLFNCS